MNIVHHRTGDNTVSCLKLKNKSLRTNNGNKNDNKQSNLR